MNDDDFEDLISLVARRLFDAGAGDLADPAVYVRLDPKTGEGELLPPQERLIEMLAAFDRHMKARDIRTYKTAIERINRNLIDGRVNGVAVVPARRERREGPIRLDAAPNLSEPRERLETLISRLRGPDRPDRVEA